MSIQNDCAYLKLYKESLKGAIEDYQISFLESQEDINAIYRRVVSLFRELIEINRHRGVIRARLVARINFIHHRVNDQHETSLEMRAYHFSSFSAEVVDDDADEFFERHMLQIANNMEHFNNRGSNLIMKNVEHIHVLLSFA